MLEHVIAPASEIYRLPDIESALERTNRSIRRKQGHQRRQKLLAKSRRVIIQSSGGVVTGKGIGVFPDESRIINVAKKIASGIAFFDTNEWIEPSTINAVYIAAGSVQAESRKERKAKNPYWVSLSSPLCLHTNFSDSIAVRRIYVVVHNEAPQILCYMLVMVMAACFIVFFDVAMTDRFNRELKLVALTDEASEWFQTKD